MSHKVLVVDDEQSYRELYTLALSDAGLHTVVADSAEEAYPIIEEGDISMVVTDVRMTGDDGLTMLKNVRETHPHLPFLLVTAFAEIRDAVAALKLGAVDYLAKPVDLTELVAAVKDELGIGVNEEAFCVPQELLSGIVALSPLMKALLTDACMVAQSDVTVLLTGESGTGKDVFSRFIHRASERKKHPYVALNCAAVAGSILGSELFGHVKGAFTGAAANRSGRFREADGGTLFLDEIGDMPMELQPLLLRALESKVITPVGSDREIKVDNRVIAATNCDLEAAVASGDFRSDLFFRLNVITLNIPPLRERPEDILPMAKKFLVENASFQKRFSRAASECLMSYDWPGNVRELLNAVKRAALLSRTELVLPEHLPPAVRRAAPVRSTDQPGAVNEANLPNDDVSLLRASSLAQTEKAAIIRALNDTNGNRTKAAERLGITRRGLIYKLKRLGIS